MARRITLPLPEFTEPVSGAIRWEGTTAGLGDVSALRSGGGPAYLVFLQLRPMAGGRVIVQVASRPGGGSGIGPELTDAWERSPRAVTLRVDDLSDLVIPGPAHASSAAADTTEPYGWRVAAGSVAAHKAWRTAFLALTSEQQESATLVLDDGAELSGIARAGIRGRGAGGIVSWLGRVARTTIRIHGDLRREPIAGAYVTADGDVLDEICWRRYGREDAVPTVLAANPRLAAGPVLPAGVLLVLPELPDTSRALPAERLWEAAPPWVVLPERETREVRLGGTFRAAIRTQG